MIALFDANFLHILFNPKAKSPRDKNGKLKVERAQDRIDYLVQKLSRMDRTKIILPAPALAEFMLLSNDSWNEYLTIIRRKAVFEIAGFDDPEAIELVELCLRDQKFKPKQSGPDTWAKLKYDHQIAAIAKTKRVTAVYSTDGGVRKTASLLEIDNFGLEDLELPPPKQLRLVESSPAEPAQIPQAQKPASG